MDDDQSREMKEIEREGGDGMLQCGGGGDGTLEFNGDFAS